MAALLANAQRLDPSPAALREYSRSHHVRRLGDHGENFAALVRTIGQNDVLKDAYLAWLRQLRPEEVEDVGTLSGAVGEPMFMLRENGREFPAPVLSDGTLRFAAITAAFFQDDMPGLLTIEEIEKGLHASRVQVLLELLRSQAEVTGTQVVATTHSAAVLDWLQEEDYKTTFLFRRDETTGESRVCSLADVPRFMDVVKKKPHSQVSDLFSEGWMEPRREGRHELQGGSSFPTPTGRMPTPCKDWTSKSKRCVVLFPNRVGWKWRHELQGPAPAGPRQVLVVPEDPAELRTLRDRIAGHLQDR